MVCGTELPEAVFKTLGLDDVVPGPNLSCTLDLTSVVGVGLDGTETMLKIGGSFKKDLVLTGSLDKKIPGSKAPDMRLSVPWGGHVDVISAAVQIEMKDDVRTSFAFMLDGMTLAPLTDGGESLELAELRCRSLDDEKKGFLIDGTVTAGPLEFDFESVVEIGSTTDMTSLSLRTETRVVDLVETFLGGGDVIHSLEDLDFKVPSKAEISVSLTEKWLSLELGDGIALRMDPAGRTFAVQVPLATLADDIPFGIDEAPWVVFSTVDRPDLGDLFPMFSADLAGLRAPKDFFGLSLDIDPHQLGIDHFLKDALPESLRICGSMPSFSSWKGISFGTLDPISLPTTDLGSGFKLGGDMHLKVLDGVTSLHLTADLASSILGKTLTLPHISLDGCLEAPDSVRAALPDPRSTLHLNCQLETDVSFDMVAGSRLEMTDLAGELTLNGATWSLHVEADATFAGVPVHVTADAGHPTANQLSFQTRTSIGLASLLGHDATSGIKSFADAVGLGKLLDDVLGVKVSDLTLTAGRTGMSLDGTIKGKFLPNALLRVQLTLDAKKKPDIVFAVLPDQGGLRDVPINGIPLSSISDQVWCFATAAKKQSKAAALKKKTAAAAKETDLLEDLMRDGLLRRGVRFQGQWQLQKKGTVEPMLRDLLKIDSVAVDGHIATTSDWSFDATIQEKEGCLLRKVELCVTPAGVELRGVMDVKVKSASFEVAVEADVSKDTVTLKGSLEADDISFNVLGLDVALDNAGILFTMEQRSKITEASLSGSFSFGELELDVEISMDKPSTDFSSENVEISAVLNLGTSLGRALKALGIDLPIIPDEIKHLVDSQLELLYMTYADHKMSLGVQVSSQRFAILFDTRTKGALIVVPLGGLISANLPSLPKKLPHLFQLHAPTALGAPSPDLAGTKFHLSSPGILRSTFVMSKGWSMDAPKLDEFPALALAMPECVGLELPSLTEGINFKLDIAMKGIHGSKDPLLAPLAFIADLFDMDGKPLGLAATVKTSGLLDLQVDLSEFDLGWSVKSFSLGLTTIGVTVGEVPEVNFAIQGAVNLGGSKLAVQGKFGFGPDHVKGALRTLEDWDQPFGLPITLEQIGMELTVLYSLEPTECAIWGGCKIGKVQARAEGYVSIEKNPGAAILIELENFNLGDLVDLLALKPGSLGGAVEHALSSIHCQKFKFVAVNMVGGYTFHEDSTYYEPGFCLDVEEMSIFGRFGGSGHVKVIKDKGLTASARIHPFEMAYGKVAGIGGGDIAFDLDFIPHEFKCHFDAQIALKFFGLNLNSEILLAFDVKDTTQQFGMVVDLYKEAIIYDLLLKSTVSSESDSEDFVVDASLKIDVGKFIKHKSQNHSSQSDTVFHDSKSKDQLQKIKMWCSHSKDKELKDRIDDLLKKGPLAVAQWMWDHQRDHAVVSEASRRIASAKKLVSDVDSFAKRERAAYQKELGDFWLGTSYAQKKNLAYQPHVPVEMRLAVLEATVSSAKTLLSHLDGDVRNLMRGHGISTKHTESEDRPNDSYDGDLMNLAANMGSATIKKFTASKQKDYLSSITNAMATVKSHKTKASVETLVNTVTAMSDFHTNLTDDTDDLDVLTKMSSVLGRLEQDPRDVSALDAPEVEEMMDLLQKGIVDHLETDADQILSDVKSDKLFQSQHLRDQADLVIQASLDDCVQKAGILTKHADDTDDADIAEPDGGATAMVETATAFEAMKKKMDRLKKKRGTFEFDFELASASHFGKSASVKVKFHCKVGKLKGMSFTLATKLTDGKRIAEAIFQKLFLAGLNKLKDLGEDAVFAIANAAKGAAKAVGKAAAKAGKDAMKDLDKSLHDLGKGVDGVNKAAKKLGADLHHVGSAVKDQANKAAKVLAAKEKEAERKAKEAARAAERKAKEAERKAKEAAKKAAEETKRKAEEAKRKAAEAAKKTASAAKKAFSHIKKPHIKKPHVHFGHHHHHHHH